MGANACNNAGAVRSGNRSKRRQEVKPRECFGVVQSGNIRLFLVCDDRLPRSRQEPPPPKDFRGFFVPGQPSRHTQSSGRRLPACQKRPNYQTPFDGRGEVQKRVSGGVGHGDDRRSKAQSFRTVSGSWTIAEHKNRMGHPKAIK